MPRRALAFPEVLEAVVQRVPPPKGSPDEPLQGLIFDSHYDPYKGVVAYVRMVNGRLGQHEEVRLMASAAQAELLEIGVFRPSSFGRDHGSAHEVADRTRGALRAG